jgi:hypothetical protein
MNPLRRLVGGSVENLADLGPGQGIRGKLNVPRERFWTTDAGDYRTVRFV